METNNCLPIILPARKKEYHPSEQGKGYGKALLDFAINEKGLHKVDVNEQNESAFRFYINQGFEIISRDETDAQGKPFPILHLQLKE